MGSMDKLATFSKVFLLILEIKNPTAFYLSMQLHHKVDEYFPVIQLILRTGTVRTYIAGLG